jgi:transposase-like protein
MYCQIQAMIEKGFSMRQISKRIRVSRNTIKKYLRLKSCFDRDTIPPSIFVLLNNFSVLLLRLVTFQIT